MSNSLHPLLKRQIEKFNLSDDTEKLLAIISDTYHQFDTTEKQLKQTLSIHKRQKRHADLKIEKFTHKTYRVANNIAEVIFETDLKGNWIYLNPSWVKLTGLKIIDCLGRPFYDFLYLIDKKDRLEFRELLDKEFDTFSKVIQFQNRNNELTWLDISLKKVKDDSGNATGYIGSIWDITEQKKIERSLVQAKEREALANKAKDEFLSTITHEIRTPLNAVIGTSHLLLLEDHMQSQLENLNVLKHSSEHLLSLVNDILDFGKIESGNIELEEITFNLKNRLKGLTATYDKLAYENKIGFSVNYDNRIPDFLVGDCTRLSQILTNLLSNAVKFTPKGQVALSINLISQNKNNAKLNFEVIDTGIGIPKEKQKKIFEAFTQADLNTSRKYGGTGLGLSISRKLAQLMNSDIKLKSEPGVGSVFSFDLNFRIGSQEFNDIKEENLDTERQLENLSVLVAEDNKVNILMIKKFLTKWSADFEIVENGLQAVERCQKKTYDVVLMDILMPEMNGFEATKAIRKFDNNTTIIALSASSGTHMEDEFIKAGMDGHIGKPFNPNLLFEILQNVYVNGKVNTKYDMGFI